MNRTTSVLCCIMVHSLVYAAGSNDLAPAESTFSLGVRETVQWSNQSPAEDLSGFGIMGRFQLGPNRELGIGIDSLSDDFDDPAGALGLQVAEGSGHPKAKIMADLISVWGQQNYDIGTERFEPFVLLGLALASIDMSEHRGGLSDGTQYDLRTNAGTEHIFMAGAGIRSKIYRGIGLEIAVRGEYHLANWTIEDRVSGAYIAADDYPALAGYVALESSF